MFICSLTTRLLSLLSTSKWWESFISPAWDSLHLPPSISFLTITLFPQDHTSGCRCLLCSSDWLSVRMSRISFGFRAAQRMCLMWSIASANEMMIILIDDNPRPPPFLQSTFSTKNRIRRSTPTCSDVPAAGRTRQGEVQVAVDAPGKSHFHRWKGAKKCPGRQRQACSAEGRKKKRRRVRENVTERHWRWTPNTRPQLKCSSTFFFLTFGE